MKENIYAYAISLQCFCRKSNQQNTLTMNSIEQNIILRDEIQSKEQNTLDDVKGLLRRYEKYRVS